MKTKSATAIGQAGAAHGAERMACPLCGSRDAAFVL